MLNALASCPGSRTNRKVPCIRICNVLVITSPNMVRTTRLGPGREKNAILTKMMLKAKMNPAPSPHNAAGCTDAISRSRGLKPLPANDRVITPLKPIPMPTQARPLSTSCKKMKAITALCTVSVLP